MADESWRDIPDPVAESERAAVAKAEAEVRVAEAKLDAAKRAVAARDKADKADKAPKKAK
jgi:hypothetical protein